MMEVRIKRAAPDELKHFGIKGQKWGVRRFENPDGTLTEEGKARYYTNSERKNVADAVKEYANVNLLKKTSNGSYTYDYAAKKQRDKIEERISKHPAVREIAAKLSSLAKEQKDASDRLDAEEDAFWKDEKLYEKYLNKAVDVAMKEEWSKNWGGRKNIYDWYKYDDGDQGTNSSIEIYKRSPEGKKLRDAEKAYWDSAKKFSDTCKSYVSEYLGNYGNDVLAKSDSTEFTVNSRLGNIVSGLARKHADFGSLDHSDILMHFGIKGQKWGVRRFENEDGTLTEEGKERYRTASDYNKAGEDKFKKYNESVDKYSQDEGIDFLEKDSRMDVLCKAISAAVKPASDRFSAACDKMRKANSMKFSSKQVKKQAIDAAELAQAKAYFEYASAFDEAGSKYISENFKPEEQDLARAAVFWAFFD